MDSSKFKHGYKNKLVFFKWLHFSEAHEHETEHRALRGTGNPTVNWQAVILYTRIQMIPRDCTAGARGIHSVYSGIFIQQLQHTWLQL